MNPFREFKISCHFFVKSIVFYSDCYSNFLALSFRKLYRIEVELIKLGGETKDTLIKIELNRDIVFQRITTSILTQKYT